MSPTREQRAWWLAVLAAAVLLGVLAMSWLAPHRAAHAEGVAAKPHAATAAHQHAGEAHSAHSHADDLDDHARDDHSHATDLLLGFFLAAVAAALLAVWAMRPQRPMVVLRRVRQRLFLMARPPDPPCLIRLSIQRC